MPDDAEITGDTDAWFALFEDGTFFQRWALTEQAIAAEAQKAHEALHHEAPVAVPYATHPTLDASDD